MDIDAAFGYWIQNAMQSYITAMSPAIGYSLVFALGNLIIDTFLRAAFSGRLYFGRGYK